ncbi:MAG: MerR family DNA-binding transcriptional regulator [Chloroflexota bacterium]|nr:MerR family DNA-binding transcriptional regulator [Chloroflexota bacterium]
MFKIGEFSRVCRVTVSTLRFYADVWLLPPAHIGTQRLVEIQFPVKKP